MLQAVKLLAGEFVERHPTYSERAGVLLLGLLLPLGPAAKGGKLPIAALKGIERINHPLLQGGCFADPQPVRCLWHPGCILGPSWRRCCSTLADDAQKINNC